MSLQAFAETDTVAAPVRGDYDGQLNELPEVLRALVARLEGEPKCEMVSDAFNSLSGLLRKVEALDINEIDEDATELFAQEFRVIRFDALDFADHVEEAAQQGLGPDAEALLNALAGVSFAVRHEMRSAFELDLEGLDAPQSPGVARAKITHAHGLLRNCFQQCIVLLARACDPEMDEQSLFDDARLRLAQSVALRDALSSLIKSVAEAAGKHYPHSAVVLVEEVEKFRRDRLRLLMRKDWETFEGFVGEIVAARERAAFVAASKRFSTYLETLLSHVQMRAVLRQSPAAPPRRASGLIWRAAKSPAAWTATTACLLLACGLLFSSRLNAKGRIVTPVAATAGTEAPAPPPSEARVATTQQPRRMATGNITVQLGAFNNPAAAAAQAAQLKSRGVEARVERAAAHVYRLQAGRFESREQAALFGKRLQAEGVVKSFVVTAATAHP